MTESVQRARDFAVTAHASQRYGDHPYVYHLDCVAAVLKPYSETTQIVGYLHDVVEDTDTTLEEILVAFGWPVSCLVGVVTDVPAPTRKERTVLTNEKLSGIRDIRHLPALIVKAADRLANIQESAKGREGSKLRMYRKEHEAFFRAAFRSGLCDEMWREMGMILNRYEQ
jgi:(p)ppGpp synthase/HD superfamily hydrolase